MRGRSIWMTVVAVILLVPAVFMGCKTHQVADLDLPDPLVFPEEFLWGTAVDAYQHEGGNTNTDWGRWEAEIPSPIDNGDINLVSTDFINRYEEDLDLVEGLNVQMFRFGIEWARVEPDEGAYDEAAFERYEEILRSSKERGLTVFLNLWHFSLPIWAADKGGFEDEEVMERFEAYVAECARRFGPYVDYWSTMIDGQIYAFQGYLLAEVPPLIADQDHFIKMYRQMLFVHARAYHTIKRVEREQGRDAQVGQIYYFYHYDNNGGFMDETVRQQIDDLFNWDFLDALYTGKLELNILGGPKLDENHEEIEGTLDWLGVNYFTREIIRFNLFKKGFVDRVIPNNAVMSEMWEVYPEGLYILGKKLSERYPDLPMFVTENGVPDKTDELRPHYILGHLNSVHRLVTEGVDIRGFFYWSLTDGWEWRRGYWPGFGLYAIDRDTLARNETRSARLFRMIVTNNRLPTEAEFNSLR